MTARSSSGSVAPGASSVSSAAVDERGPDPPVEIRVDDGRMDVRLARDGRRVAEAVGRLPDRGGDVALLLALARALADRPQRPVGEDRARPTSGSPWR